MSDSERRTKWEFIILGCMYIGYMGYILCRMALPVASAGMVDDPNLDFTKTMYGEIIGWGTLGMVAGKLLNGIVADWLGGRRVFIAALVCTATMGTTFTIGTTFAYFASVNFIMLYCAAAGWPAMANIIAAWYPEKLGRVWGIVSTSSRLSALLSPIFLGSLLIHFKWKYVFFAASTGGILVAVLIFLFLKARPEDVGLTKAPETEFEPVEKKHFLDDKDLKGALLAFATSGRFWLICLSLMCTTVLMEFITFLPLFLKSFGVSPAQAAMSSSVFPAGCFIALIAGGFLYDNVTRKGRIGLLGGLLAITCLCISGLWLLLDTGLTGHTQSVNAVAFAPDGKTIASASDKTVKIWGSATGKLIATDPVAFASDVKPIATLNGHTERVNSVAFAPDGKSIVSASSDKTVKIWESSGKLIATLNGHTKSVNSVAFAPNGKTIASASSDKTVKIWESSGKLIATFNGHTESVNAVAFTLDGKTIASASSDKTVKIRESSGKLIATLNGHTESVNSVAFAPDGKTIASASSDKTVKIWESGGKLTATLKGHGNHVKSVAFAPNGKILASASNDDKVKLWKSANGELITTHTGHTNDVNSVAFAPDSKTLVSVSKDKSIKLWESAKMKTSSKFYITIIILFFFGLTVAPAYYLPMSIFSNEFGGKYCGLLIGIIDAAGYGASAMYQFSGGRLVDNYGWQAMIILFFVISIFAIVITCWFAFEDSKRFNV